MRYVFECRGKKERGWEGSEVLRILKVEKVENCGSWIWGS